MNFFTYLTNGTSQQQQAVGSDFISEHWRPRSLSSEMRAVRRALFVDPDRPESVNWGAWSICRMLPATDLATLLGRFTAVSEYVPSEMLATMAELFRPQITDPAIVGKVRITPQIRTAAYRLHNISVSIGEGSWEVRTYNKPVITGMVSTGGIESAVIYDENTLVFPSKTEGSWQLNFASPGIRTIADIANDLRTTAKPALAAILRLPSLLSDDDKVVLGNACHIAYEPPIIVGAAALLLAGATGVRAADTL